MRCVPVCLCVEVLVWFLCGALGGIQGRQSAGVVWATALPCLAAFAQCARGTVGDERES